MPSYTGFDDLVHRYPDDALVSINSFRKYLLNRTLKSTYGVSGYENPVNFNENSYTYKNFSDYSNIDQPTVDASRQDDLYGQDSPTTKNIYKPSEFRINENLATIERRANLSLYYNGTPYFVMGNHNLVSIMSTAKYETESELFKFAAINIRENRQGPVFARIAQNLETATLGRARILDALQGNSATALNIITGKEPLIELNYKITVANSLAGKGIDFLQTVSGIEFPFSEIPGDYLTNPRNPVENRPEAKTEAGKIFQDVTGVLGSLIGISRRPKLSRKPSDLFIEYMGQGQKQTLYDLLSYSTYAPNYTATARSQQSSKTFALVDQFAQGVNRILGLDAPKGLAYIGDDRGNDVKFAMSDFNDRMVKSPFYLGLMFDEVQTVLFQRNKNISEGGSVGSQLTWISKNSRNKLGINNENYSSISSKYEDSLSNNYTFRKDSILGYTQEIIDSLPTDAGEARTHVANVIDQTSRIFREGDVYLSRGSAIQYVDKFGQHSGVEYCRTWTKDRPYLTYSDTMKKGMNVRKFESSVMSNPWNLNIAPMVKNKKDFTGSTNIFKDYPFGSDRDGKSWYAKKYMFSIENLAWKSSNMPGFTVLDLPYCERGPNGGRVMWFPPYDLKISETNQARWESNSFLGRPEPIYTYQNTERSGQISFKVVVDHPSILNLLVREKFKDMSDEEADNYIHAFFAGCEDIDFYELIKTYTTLSSTDVQTIISYLNDGKNANQATVQRTKVLLDDKVVDNGGVVGDDIETPIEEPGPSPTGNWRLNFEHDFPKPKTGTVGSETYSQIYSRYKNQKSLYSSSLNTEITQLFSLNTKTAAKDKEKLLGSSNQTQSLPTIISSQQTKINQYFDELATRYNDYTGFTETLKNEISGNTVQYITLEINSSTSAVAKNYYNRKLSLRRSHSVIQDVFDIISKDGTKPNIIWKTEDEAIAIPSGETVNTDNEYSLKDFGWTESIAKIRIVTKNYGEESTGKTSNQVDTNCVNKDFFAVKGLDLHAPISFYCRASDVTLKYNTIKKSIKKTKPDIIPPNKVPQSTEIVTVIPPPPKVPQIDVMKRIVMKTLSECFYFQMLEETSPVQFSSLKEKLKYFHPGFHSTTPEGLNSRLTFLQQCLRPGDTIPIKGLADPSDLSARNTSFGPPPVCVLRIGDFYNSKIIIRDVTFTYDDNVWDLNPEGIGVQPMIATVSLAVSFIGGQSLEKPIERLQNALSSNFYANTEMYDERSESTTQKINGMDASGFTKTFLEELMNSKPKQVAASGTGENEITNDKYIGTPLDGELDYTEITTAAWALTRIYFDMYPVVYNTINKKYGPIVTTLLLSETYRPIKTYDIFTISGNMANTSMRLFGLPKNGSELNILFNNFSKELLLAADAYDPCLIIEFNKDLISDKMYYVNVSLKPLIKDIITKKLSEISNLITSDPIASFELKRNELISTLDNLNFIVQYGKDGKVVKKSQVIEATLDSFNSTDFYENYSGAIDYFKNATDKMYADMDNSVDFFQPVITEEVYKNILKVWLADKTQDVLKTFNGLDDATKTRAAKRLEKFVITIKDKIFKFGKLKTQINDNPIRYTFTEAGSTDDDFNIDIKVLNSDIFKSDEKLNYYKSPKKK